MKTNDIPAVNRILKRQYGKHRAPVIQLMKAKGSDPFRILVSTILSARTKDGTTSQVCKRLFAKVRKASDLEKLTLRQLETLIFPIGFYRTKARHLKQLPSALARLPGRSVPQTIPELCELPGVGRKTANLVMTEAFDKHAICVDIHVHRICNRLGLIRTRTPLETEMKLREILPKRYWKTWNPQLVSFGQTVCTPVSPMCSDCPMDRHCMRVGVRKAR